jgi:hypothetical protein
MTEENANTDSELTNFLSLEGRLRTIAWLATLLPLAVFFALFYLTVREQGRLQALRQQETDLTSKIADLQSTLDRKNLDLLALQSYTAKLTVTVDIYFANEAQRPKVNEITAQFEKLGYDVNLEDRPRRDITQNSYVRYFFREDEQLAHEIQEQLKSLGVPVDVQSFADLADRASLGEIHPRGVELWLGKRYNPSADLHESD